jgi:hypothetical protein
MLDETGAHRIADDVPAHLHQVLVGLDTLVVVRALEDMAR